ncbi:MAG: DMT family transporter [Thermoanaerobaculia bacterium]
MHAEKPDLHRRVLVALLVVQLCFSSLHLVGKIVLRELPPFALAGMRLLLATPVLLLLAWRRDRLIPPRRDWPTLALLGLFGITANQLLFLSGLSLTSASSASVLMPSIPVFTAGAAVILGLERWSWPRFGGVTLAVLGALVLLDPGHLESGTRAVLGNSLILLNCLSYSVYLVVQRPVLLRLPWRTVIAWTFLFGTLGALPWTAASLFATGWGALQPVTIAGVLWIALVPTALAFSLNSWASRRTDASVVAAFTTLQPLLTILVAIPLLGEKPSWNQGVGFLLIAAGLVVVRQARAIPPTSPPKLSISDEPDRLPVEPLSKGETE